MELIFLRFNSHRAYQKAERLLGRKMVWFWTWDKGGRFATVTQSEHTKIRQAKVKGVTKCRDQKPETYSRCWVWSEIYGTHN